ncbi:hypothetical protein [Salmonella phage vB_SenS_Psm105]
MAARILMLYPEIRINVFSLSKRNTLLGLPPFEGKTFSSKLRESSCAIFNISRRTLSCSFPVNSAISRLDMVCASLTFINPFMVSSPLVGMVIFNFEHAYRSNQILYRDDKKKRPRKGPFSHSSILLRYFRNFSRLSIASAKSVPVSLCPRKPMHNSFFNACCSAGSRMSNALRTSYTSQVILSPSVFVIVRLYLLVIFMPYL